MARDFKASQIRTNKLIASRSVDNQPGLLIYSASNATNFEGGAISDLLTDVGSDVFLFVSGSKTNNSDGSVAYNYDSSQRTDVSVFGGDLVVSGTLYAEVLFGEVDMTTTGSATIEGPLYVTQSATIYQGLTVNESGESGAYSDFRVEGDTSTHLIFADASADRVSIGTSTATPNALLEVTGDGSTGANALHVTHAVAGYHAMMITADALTSAKGLVLSADALTTGKGIDVSSTSNALNGAVLLDVSADSTSTDDYTIVKITKSTTNADASNAIVGLDIDFDATAGAAARALRIVSDQTDGVVAEISMAGRTTGTGLLITDTGTGDNAGNLVKIHQDGSRAGSAASIGLLIDFDTVANAGARALKIASDQTTGVVAEIVADAVTTGDGLHITADALTTGHALNVTSTSNNLDDGSLIAFTYNGTSDNENSLVQIVDQNPNSSKTTALEVIKHSAFDNASGSIAVIRCEGPMVSSNTLTLDVYDTNAGARPKLKLFRSHDTVADGMELGVVSFQGLDTAGNDTEYVYIETQATDTTNSAEDGYLKLNIVVAATARTLFSAGSKNGDEDPEVVINEDAQDVNFRVESENKTHAIMVSGSSDKVIFLSSSAVPNGDVSFFVSGSTGDRLSSKGGVSLFAGDLVTSGVMSVEDDLSVGNDLWVGDNAYISGTLQVGERADFSGSVYVGNANEDSLYVHHSIIGSQDNTSTITFNEGTLNLIGGSGAQIRLTNAGGADANTGGVAGTAINYNGFDADTYIWADTSPTAPTKALFKGIAQTGHEQVLILSGGAGASYDETAGVDVAFYVSGSRATKGTDEHGTAVFGGDVVVSGNMHIAEYIYHEGDNDTFVRLQEDHIEFFVGEAEFLDLTEDTTQDIFYVNPAGGDIDFKVAAFENTAILNVDAILERVQIDGSEDGSSSENLFEVKNSLGEMIGLAQAAGIVFNEVGHASADLRVESDNRTHAVFVDAGTDQVFIMSGANSDSNSVPESSYGDLAFFVSGAMGSRGTSTKGTAVFGGDLLTSGNIHLSDVLSISKSGTKSIIVKALQTGGSGGGSFEIQEDGGTAVITVSEGSDNSGQLTINDDFGNVDFIVHSNGASGANALKIDASTRQILVLSGGAGGSRDDAKASDVAFFVSGSRYSAGRSDRRGASVFGGDLVVSGGLYGGDYFEEYGNPVSVLPLYANQVMILPYRAFHSQYGVSQVEYIEGAGSDTHFYVSGTRDSRGVVDSSGTSVFSGDVLHSGSIYIEDGQKIVFGAVTTTEYIQDGASNLLTVAAGGKIYLDAGDDIVLDTIDLIELKKNGSTYGYMESEGSTTDFHLRANSSKSDVVITTSEADGATELIRFGAPTTSIAGIVINETSADHDFRIESNNHESAFAIDGGLGRVVILSGSTSDGNSASQADAADVAFYVSGSVGHKDRTASLERHTSLFGGDTVVSGTLWAMGGEADVIALAIGDATGSPYGTTTPRDAILWVSGNVGHAASSDAGEHPGIAVFGGDVVLSGALLINPGHESVPRVPLQAYVDAGRAIEIVNDANPTFTVNTDGIPAFTFKVHDRYGVALEVNSAGGVVINDEGHASCDFRVESDNRNSGIFLDSGNNQLFILSGSTSDGNSLDESDFNDLAFFVSGSAGSRSTSEKGTALFGGDLVTSGTLYADTLNEETTAAGVTIDGVLIKDNDIVIPDGATIGATSAATAMTIASTGIVTFVDDILIKDAGTIGNASVAAVMTLASTGIVTFADDILIKDDGTIGNASNATLLKLETGAVEVSGNIIPNADSTRDLGAADARWANVYTGDLHLKNDRGDWTVVEEEDYLSICNNKTGKRYKFVLEEIED